MRVASKLLATALVAVAITAGPVHVGLAQDATPGAMEGDNDTLVSHLHSGSCADLSAEPVERLADLSLPDWVAPLASGDTAAAESEGVSAADFGNAPVPVAVSTTSVDIALADIVAGKHAINVERAEPADNEDTVACGDIGGVADSDGNLFVGLVEENDSGHTGVAWLHDDGMSTTIVVMVSHPDQQSGIAGAIEALAAAEMAAATPAAPAATPEAPASGTPVS
jgi:hypothetical protein